MKQLRIVYDTGELGQNARPIRRRTALVISDEATAQNCEQIVQLLDSLTKYTALEAHMVIVEQVY
ncbi:hypothetical protein [Pseudothermotoga thermarum]|uniref:Uncharacterized protein n=1 Tax=Pseudothermotoga thermarum DSM 5069 TaxID=688269 RepID=F7YV35_9THEM|nr:hypothetical protein [Pseudothermotoga thermarum]AEH50328.1 hypothetical protein Theth_0227 [Pseudothermotoga thermarum DSM 5069]